MSDTLIPLFRELMADAPVTSRPPWDKQPYTGQEPVKQWRSRTRPSNYQDVWFVIWQDGVKLWEGWERLSVCKQVMRSLAGRYRNSTFILSAEQYGVLFKCWWEE